MILKGKKRSTRRRTGRSATLSATKLMRIGLGSKPGLRCEKPATNSLSYNTYRQDDD